MTGQTINVISASNASDADAATYTINTDPYGSTLADNIVFSDGIVKINGLVGQYGSTSVVNFNYNGHDLYINGRGGLGGVLVDIPFVDQSPADQGTHLEVSRLGDSFYVTEGTLHQPAGAILLPGSAVAPMPPAATVPPAQPGPQTVTAHDNTTGLDLADTSSVYAGPVAGISSQFISLSPDNINVTAMADGVFIKTGSGNDAIAVYGGTNVVDGGAGSNFLTGGSGFDTFFADARNIPATVSAAGPVPGAIWNTIQEFTSGDAVTLWGVGRAAALSWQGNQGAAGHTGLTLHANKANGTEVSLTFAGIDSKAGLSLSYGQAGGVDYLYVKSV